MRPFLLACVVSALLVTCNYAEAVCQPVRDAHGKIKRSSYQLYKFKKQHPCPATGQSYGKCPGYVIDHIIPLACCGVDRPSNMQWQTVADARAKDKIERKQCGGTL